MQKVTLKATFLIYCTAQQRLIITEKYLFNFKYIILLIQSRLPRVSKFPEKNSRNAMLSQPFDHKSASSHRFPAPRTLVIITPENHNL